MSCKVRKTEHCGAKNGGGYWGTRIEAKQDGKKVRRHNDKKAVLDALEKGISKASHTLQD